MKFSLTIPVLVATMLAACNPDAPDPVAAPAPGLQVEEAWARATIPGAAMSAAYFTIRNGNATSDVLLGVSSAAAGRTELHRSVMEQGMARMRPAGEVSIGAGETLRAGPGGLHVMLMELHAPLAEGATVPLSLRFRDAGTIVLDADVRGVTSDIHGVP